MRDFFISAFEKLVGVIVVLMTLGVLVGAVAAIVGGGIPGSDGQVQGGPLAGLALLVAGLIYVIFLGGALYLGVGIYQNTKRTAEAMERMAQR